MYRLWLVDAVLLNFHCVVSQVSLLATYSISLGKLFYIIGSCEVQQEARGERTSSMDSMDTKSLDHNLFSQSSYGNE